MKNLTNKISNEEKTKMEKEIENLNQEISKIDKLIEFVTPTIDKVSLNKQQQKEKENEKEKESKKDFFSEKKKEYVENLENIFDDDQNVEKKSFPLLEKTSSDLKNEKKKKKKRKVKGPSKDELFFNENNPKDFDDDDQQKYSNWIAPQGQSGDGKTQLNAKYGY